MDTVLHHLKELWAERSRVALVVLGVLWGTLSLTILFSFGNEFVNATTQTSRNLGAGLLRVGNGSTAMSHAGFSAGRFVERVPEDAQAVLAGVPGVEAVAAERLASSQNPLEAGTQRMNVRVTGVTPSFGDLRHQVPQPGGRFLNERDEAEHRRVMFLGSRTAERLFAQQDPVGRNVELWDRSFLVVGVLVPRVTSSNYSGDDRDKVMIPLSTFQDLFGGRWIHMLWVRFADPDRGPVSRATVMDQVFATLAARHGIHPQDRDAISMQDYVEIEDMIDLILEGNRVFMVVVGVIGLLVALIGVANVTYVMVEERTREIGVQMALGARPRDMALARLFESVLVTLTGGLVGLALTAGLLRALERVELGPEVRAYLGHPSVSWQVGLVVVSMLVAGGALAGWVPARRAAAMNPVDALREE